MVESKCSLSDNCHVVNEGKKQKRFIRLIDCRNCQRSFHTYCAGWQDKTEGQINEEVQLFVCDSCNNFLDAITERLGQKVSALLNSFRSEIHELLEKSLSSNNIKHTSNIIQPSAENDKSINAPLSNYSSNKNDTSDNICNSDTNNNKSEQTPIHEDRTKAAVKKHCYYLCSVETVLSVEDVKLILNDTGVNTEELEFNTPAGNFKSRKYLMITSSNTIKLFSFKLNFNKSSLNGTWFLRDTPPKNKIAEKHNNKEHSYTKRSTTRNENKHYSVKEPFSHRKGLLPTPLMTDSNNAQNRHIINRVPSSHYTLAQNETRPNYKSALQNTNSNIEVHDSNNMINFLEQALKLAKMK